MQNPLKQGLKHLQKVQDIYFIFCLNAESIKTRIETCILVRCSHHPLHGLNAESIKTRIETESFLPFNILRENV